MTRHTVVVPNSIRRWILRLPPDIRDRILTAIAHLKTQPRPPGCEKLSGTTNEYRIRVGDYRVRYEIDDRQQLVVITRCAHRRDVYRH